MPIEHEQAIERMSAHLEGELSPQHEAELVAHLAECRDCRAELEALRATVNSLSGLHALPPPPRFAQKVEQRLRERTRGRGLRHASWLSRVPFEWISFIAILVMLVWYLMIAWESRNAIPVAPGVAPGRKANSAPDAISGSADRPNPSSGGASFPGAATDSATRGDPRPR